MVLNKTAHLSLNSDDGMRLPPADYTAFQQRRNLDEQEDIYQSERHFSRPLEHQLKASVNSSCENVMSVSVCIRHTHNSMRLWALVAGQRQLANMKSDRKMSALLRM